MLTTKVPRNLGAVAIAVFSVNFPTTKINAQSTTADSFNFEDISAGDQGGWNFKSEDETASLRDEIQQLGEYNISDANNFNVKLVQENRTWANKGDRPYYYIENKIAPYYFIKTRVYGY